MNKQDILIRLLKNGHITDEEFKLLYQDVPEYITPPLPTTNPWFGVYDPLTNQPIGPTYTTPGLEDSLPEMKVVSPDFSYKERIAIKHYFDNQDVKLRDGN